MHIAIVAASVTSDAPSATIFASSWRPLGTSSTATMPTSGIAPTTVTQGNPELIAASPDSHEHEGRGHGHHTGEHRQGIAAGEAGLRPPHACAGAADQCREAVDDAVDTSTVE